MRMWLQFLLFPEVGDAHLMFKGASDASTITNGGAQRRKWGFEIFLFM